MKVSRKVGRRKHSDSSSISRRRLRSKKSYKKNSYRKKNAKTQKGGKRGRGYKRMRVKMVHRGGAGKWNETKWKEEVEGNPSTIIATGLLVYQKVGIKSITSQTKPCRVTLEKTSELIKIPGENGYPGENFIRFKVTMKRYKDGVNTNGVPRDSDFNKIFTIYFAFGYVPHHAAEGGQHATEWFLFQTTEDEEQIKQTLLYWDPVRYGFYPHESVRMEATLDYNGEEVSIKLPEEFKGIIGDDIPGKQKPDKYIFWGEKMGLTNSPDNDRSNVDFFNSLATQMYRIVRKTEYDALFRPAAAARADEQSTGN